MSETSNTNDTHENIRRNIRALRIMGGLSIRAAAEESGLPFEQLEQIENGDIEADDGDIRSIAVGLEIDRSLITGEPVAVSDEMLDSIATLIEAEERASFAIETASDALSDIQFTIKDLTENAKSLALGGAK